MSENTTVQIRPGGPLRGTTGVPGDKSISHRALILGSLADGVNHVRGWLAAGDTLATLNAMHTLGIEVERQGDSLSFRGGRLLPPNRPIDCANAGTAMRLLAGLLAGQPFDSVLDGSEQLRHRPMRRLVEPLRLMGAQIGDTDGHAPLSIYAAERLTGIRYEMPVASAQVKSALLLAGLHAEGQTEIIEPGPTRDHTERMLTAMGVPINTERQRNTVPPRSWVSVGATHRPPLQALELTVPGDISSAAFLIVAAALVPGSTVHLTDAGLNPTRTGLLDILGRMGADITVEASGDQGGEPVGDLHVRGGELRATRAGGDEIVRAIDEVPVLAIAATQAHGQTMITGAAELRVKEVDRIGLLVHELRRMGAEIDELPDGMVINGPTRLKGAPVDSHGDHRLGMALAVAGLVADGETQVHDAGCIADSFPGFARTLAQLGAEISR
jgi:3-phosphoshikimate 1-carboxyvinyltransferase